MSASSVTIKTLLNQYRIEEFVTLTPFGDLYRAIDERNGKSVALTILSKAIADDPETLKELESNNVRLQTLHHPNLNKHLGLQKTPDQAFLLEDWVDGPSLKDLRGKGRLGANEILFITKSACAGLEALHKQNLLHLHLAPEFIRINKRGEVILCGLAGAKPANTKAVVKFSKYQAFYKSPEQLREEKLTPAADIYSLAVILYELTTTFWINGKAAPKTSDAIRKTHLDVTPPAPATFNHNLPDNFSRMILWALRKNP
ncbi:MAG: serine/threonine-protein kinase, partial [Anaerolineales bacterium]